MPLLSRCSLWAAGEMALNSMRAVAQATIQELQGKIKDRDAQIASLEGKLGHQREDYAVEREQLRAEVQVLTQQLMQRDNAQIGQAREAMEAASRRVGLKGNGKEDIPYDELRRLLNEQTVEIEKKAAVVLAKESMILVGAGGQRCGDLLAWHSGSIHCWKLLQLHPAPGHES
jgi:hypothetical protein